MPKHILETAEELYGPDVSWGYNKTLNGGTYIVLKKGAEILFSWVGSTKMQLIEAFEEHIYKVTVEKA